MTAKDALGNEAVDFAVAQVVGDYKADALPPGLHAVYHPTLDLHPGTPITFKVRSFKVPPGDEEWDFGDNSAPATAHSVPIGMQGEDAHAPGGYAPVQHAYAQPGRYIATARRTGPNGLVATARVNVIVEP